jgi:hypothetical protein
MTFLLKRLKVLCKIILIFRIQVGLLMGDMMETIDKKFEEEQKNRLKVVPSKPISSPIPI